MVGSRLAKIQEFVRIFFQILNTIIALTRGEMFLRGYN